MYAAKGIAVFPFTTSVLGHSGVIHVTLLHGGGSAVLVDTGYPGHAGQIREGIVEALGMTEPLRAIVITHHDIDHTGGGGGLLELLQGKVETIAHRLEAPYIRGEKRPIKMTDESIARILAALPAEIPRERREAFRFALEHPPVMPVTREVAGSLSLPLAGGITLVETPGHTPGHLAVYHAPSRTLVAGDALTAENGKLALPDPALCSDPAAAFASVKALASAVTLGTYRIERVVCYHGGIVEEDPAGQLRELSSDRWR